MGGEPVRPVLYPCNEEAHQHLSCRQLHAFMHENGTALAVALAPELMYLDAQPEMVRERTLDRAAASIREALTVHLAGGAEVDYAEEDQDILTAIGFRPDRASREDNRAIYSPE